MVQALCYLLSCGCGTPAVGYNVKLRLAKIISPLFSRSTRGALRYYVTSVPVYVSIDAHAAYGINLGPQTYTCGGVWCHSSAINLA